MIDIAAAVAHMALKGNYGQLCPGYICLTKLEVTNVLSTVVLIGDTENK